jgi:hypothetical protein
MGEITLSSEIVTRGIVYVASKYSEVVRKGRLPAVLLGFLLAAGGGACVMFIEPYYGILAGLFTGMLGALVGAVFFPRPDVLLNKYGGESPDRVGTVITTLTSHLGEFAHMIVVLERAYFIVSYRGEPPAGISQSLAKGVYPSVEGGTLIPHSSVLHLEVPPPDYRGSIYSLTFYFVTDGRKRSRTIEFASRESLDRFLTMFQGHCGRMFRPQPVPMELRRAILLPLLLLIVTGALSIGLAVLSNHWTLHPPPPPVGKSTQDPLVKGVVRIGPTGWLIGGGVVSLGLGAWLCRRFTRPPLIHVLNVNSAEPGEDLNSPGLPVSEH